MSEKMNNLMPYIMKRNSLLHCLLPAMTTVNTNYFLPAVFTKAHACLFKCLQKFQYSCHIF